MSTEIKETETLSEQEVINTYQMLRQEVSLEDVPGALGSLVSGGTVGKVVVRP